jgi:hypothetical protein
MYSKPEFYALEVMCRERAAAARKELDYWLAEAEEWARVRLSSDHGSGPFISALELVPDRPNKRRQTPRTTPLEID